MTAPSLNGFGRRAGGSASLSRWTTPTLRVGMGLFLAAWGLDKIFAVEGSQRIFERFYQVHAGPSLIQLAGGAEVVLAILLAVGVLRRPVAWVVLLVNFVSTFASWRQILDPWGLLGIGPGGTHLFLASIVIISVSVVLVLNAHDESGTIEGWLSRRNASGDTGTGTIAA